MTRPNPTRTRAIWRDVTIAPSITIAALAQRHGCVKSVIRHHLTKLEALGYIRVDGFRARTVLVPFYDQAYQQEAHS